MNSLKRINLSIVSGLLLLSPFSVKALETGLGATAGEAGFTTGAPNVEGIVGNLIGVFLSLLGVIFLVLIIYAGYDWMMARGDSKKVQVAKDRITNAVIGLIIVLGSYIISGYVLTRLIQATKGNP